MADPAVNLRFRYRPTNDNNIEVIATIEAPDGVDLDPQAVVTFSNKEQGKKHSLFPGETDSELDTFGEGEEFRSKKGENAQRHAKATYTTKALAEAATTVAKNRFATWLSDKQGLTLPTEVVVAYDTGGAIIV